MPRAARHQDTCGGQIIATAQKTKINGRLVARVGDKVTPHGEDEHAAAVMTEGSGTVKVEGKKPCRMGDKATCGDSVSTASSDVKIGG